MNWLRSHPRSAWIIGLTLLLPALLYLNALLALLDMRRDYQSQIGGLEPRIARLQGLIAHEEQLRVAAGEVDMRVVDLVYPAAEDRATVSTRLQKEVREMLVEAGLSVSNSQVLPVREQDLFDYVGVKLTVTGDLASLDAALVAIASYMPLLLVESLDVLPRGAGRRSADSDEQAISATLQLLSLRALQ